MEKKRKKINLRIAIEVLILTTTLAVVTSMAKFRTTIITNDSAVVAVPILSSTTLNLTTIYPRMDPIEYDLVVENIKNTMVSQVALSYLINIENVGNLPLKIEMYISNNEVKEGENLLVDGRTSSMEMPITQVSHTYKLIVSWDNETADFEDYKYSGETSFLKIDVDAVQKN